MNKLEKKVILRSTLLPTIVDGSDLFLSPYATVL